MESWDNMPTAADYAASDARRAKQAAESAAAENKRLEERVGVLEAKVKGLFKVIDYIVDGDKLNFVLIDDETGEVEIHRAYD